LVTTARENTPQFTELEGPEEPEIQDNQKAHRHRSRSTNQRLSSSTQLDSSPATTVGSYSSNTPNSNYLQRDLIHKSRESVYKSNQSYQQQQPHSSNYPSHRTCESIMDEDLISDR